MGGAILQLAAKGAQDAYLIDKPQITFFKTVFRRHTNFSLETIETVFSNTVNFGQKVNCIIPSKGDLISNIYIKINLKELPQDCNCNINSYWINSIGHALLSEIELKIGGLLIDRHYSEWMEVWGELTQNEEKRAGYFEMIGKITDGLSTINKEKFKGPLQLYVPLNFWFCRNIGVALPLIALQYHDVELSIKIRPFDECYITSDGSKLECGDYLSMCILIDYVYLDTSERKQFAQNSHEYLIEQIQYNINTVTTGSSINIPITFNHPVKEIIWFLRRTDVKDVLKNDCNEIISYGNDWFNFSDTIGTIHGFNDTFDKATLQMNGSSRFSPQSADYFRLLQTYIRHSRVPSKQIYVYSFALRPEEYQPTGSCNYSRIDNSILNLTFNSNNTVEYNSHVFATNYNVLRIKGGMAGLAYSN
jgi:hypothetical protein